MSELEPLMVAELRQEFRRTRPPRQATRSEWSAGIFRISSPQSIGYRIFWFKASQHPQVSLFTRQQTTFQLLEILSL